MLLQCFLLSLTAGVAIVPGAVTAFCDPRAGPRRRSPRSRASSSFCPPRSGVPAASEGRYKERYLLSIVPLLGIAFGLHLRDRRSHRLIVPAIGAALIVAAPQLPLSGYTFNAPYYDSQTLNVAWLLQRHVGASTSSLLLALFVTAAAAIAIAACWRTRIRVVALPLSIACMLVVTVVAVHVDRVLNQKADDPAWIDNAVGGAHVTAVATPASPRLPLLRQLYWNASIDREVLLEEPARPTPTGERRSSSDPMAS